jgi:hypothetical protein
VAKRKQPKKRGRPPKIVADDKTIATITGLAQIQCTQEEAAAVLGVHRDTFGDFLRRDKKGREAWENGLLRGKASLRRTQFRLAETNAGMAIFLGKNMLGQRDQIEHSGEAAILKPTINITIGTNEQPGLGGVAPAFAPQAGPSIRH